MDKNSQQQQVNQLRMRFRNMTTTQKKQFIANFKQQIQAANVPLYNTFLNECTQLYNAEITGGARAANMGVARPGRKKGSPAMFVLGCLVMVFSIAAIGYFAYGLSRDAEFASYIDVFFEQYLVEEEICFQPLWNTGRFTNNRIESLPSNGALADSIRAFYYIYASQLSSRYQYMDEYMGYQIDPHISYAFRTALSQGFQADYLSRTKPFNTDFWDLILSNTYFYFASLPYYSESNYIGRYVNLEEISHVFVATTNTPIVNEDEFVFTAIHEMGHALGLGESLSDLKAELHLGREAPRKGLDVALDFLSNEFDWIRNEWESELLHYEWDSLEWEWILSEIDYDLERIRLEDEVSLTLDWVGGYLSDIDLSYNSTFDRVLLNMAGPARFWRAAYTSNYDFGILWDAYMYTVISHDEVQLIRGLIYEASKDRPELGRQFQSYTGGLSLNWAAWTFLNSFRDLVDQYGHLDTAITDSQSLELFRFRTRLSTLTGFAQAHNVEPQPSVLDFVIISHALRH